MHASEHFIWVAPPRIREVVHQMLGTIAWRELGTARALELWKKGFPHLHITPEGARHYFGQLTAPERTALLAVCKTEEERAAIAQAGYLKFKNGQAPKPAPPPEPPPAPEPAADTEDAPAPRARRVKRDTPGGESPAE